MFLSRMFKTHPFWILTITFILILVVSQLIQDGAFMDGMLYASVSKNLADGIGTFWDPHFCKTYQSSFHEQPPLYFGILAFFYKIFGTSMYIERFFCFTCFVVTAIYIHKLWNKIYIQQSFISNNSWLPILFWISIPISFWAYTNFVEEVLLSLFVVIAVYYIFIGLFLNTHTIYNLIIAGFFIFLSSLTKGIQGLFPIVSVGAYWLITKNISFKKTFLYSLILIGVPFLIYVFLLATNNDVYTSFETYFKIRIEGTFKAKSATTDYRLFLLAQLFWQLLPINIVCIIFLFITRKYKIPDSKNKAQNHIIIWLILIGLSGSLPLMITLEQRTFYLVTALPFFAIAIVMLPAAKISHFIEKIDTSAKKFKFLTLITCLILSGSVIFSITKIGKAKRDKDMLEDVYSFGKIIPRGTTISIPQPMCFEFSFKEYMIRYFYISSDDKNRTHKYLIIRKDLPRDLIPANYKQYPVKTKTFDLFILGRL